ncbi:unnamed protein product [Rodentolepis nana]|uniref:G-protein coupled receptors family 1 profile domain-containing protein n=1 Tax=Rodentolepis nana TaxID=102285 RepID=A0A0R3T455_RODNA|nr:unnamed protein product [Rodentolepis nana]
MEYRVIPSSVSHIIWGIWSESSNFTIPWMVVNEVGNLFITVNHSVNIIPYYLFSKRFRTLFVVIYFGWIKRCYNIQKKVTPLSRQILPTSSPNARPRMLSRTNFQPIIPLAPIHTSPIPRTPLTDKNGSCSFILVKL